MWAGCMVGVGKIDASSIVPVIDESEVVLTDTYISNIQGDPQAHFWHTARAHS